jgi:hypothetical protein
VAAETQRTAVYPGSFNPPTTAHLAIAEAVRAQRNVDRVVFMVSKKALAKEEVEHPRFQHRVAVLEAAAAAIEWLEIGVTDDQLLVDIARGFDVLVMGADKWHQINDVVWYDDDPAQRDAAIAALPTLAIAPRPPIAVPNEHLLAIHDDHAATSSTRARAGALELMLPSAAAFALETGAWIEPSRYDHWVAGRPA